MTEEKPATEALAPVARFDWRLANPFIYKSLSLETRAAYRRGLEQFFRAVGWLHPAEITKEHVLAYREQLLRDGRQARTIRQRLSVVRSFFDYLQADGLIGRNPASTKLVTPPPKPASRSGRALTKQEALYLLSAPDRRVTEGARDFAMITLMLRLSLRVSEVCSLRCSSMRWDEGRWTLACKIKSGREEVWPLPQDIRQSVEDYLRLDRERRATLGTGGDDAWLFQPTQNYRTLVHDKPISRRQVENLVRKWADYAGLGRVTPHDLRRTVLTEMLKRHPAQDVQMVSKHRDIRTLLGYFHDSDNLERNPVNTFSYDSD
jgi:integrase/recombinase XerD